MPLDRSQFLQWLEARRELESLAAIGEDMGVSYVTVSLWLCGRRLPSRMALRLAELLVERAPESWPLMSPAELVRPGAAPRL